MKVYARRKKLMLESIQRSYSFALLSIVQKRGRSPETCLLSRLFFLLAERGRRGPSEETGGVREGC